MTSNMFSIAQIYFSIFKEHAQYRGEFMADNKKYYYIKLKEDFFDREEIVLLEGERDGFKYSNFLLKLYLKSLRGDGRLIFNEFIPYDTKMLAKITRFSENFTKKALKKLQNFGLIEVLDDGVIYMLNIQDFIGESSTEADRKRVYRRKIEDEKNGQMSGQMSDKCTPEIEIDKEIEIEIDKDIEIDDKSFFTLEVNKFIKNKVTSSSIENFIGLYGIESLKSLITEIQKSDYLKENINFNSLSPDFVDKAIHGRYRTYRTNDFMEKEEGENPYGKVPPFELN